MTHQLISQVFYPAFRNPLLEQDHDGCVFLMEEGRLAYSTDSFVVDPIFFPGGDIGDLAINGTVNDLACCGARPLYLTAGFILEEGLPLADLQRIVQSMKRAETQKWWNGANAINCLSTPVGSGSSLRAYESPQTKPLPAMSSFVAARLVYMVSRSFPHGKEPVLSSICNRCRRERSL